MEGTLADTTTISQRAFTLIELSLVLVIIGLLVGGILVGRDLINAAATRAQISQIEIYNRALNTFQVKYGYRPGDIPDPAATQFGFSPRGTLPGQGDGDGIVAGFALGACAGWFENGENLMFWVDLTVAGLADVGMSKATPTNAMSSSTLTPTTNPSIGQYLPRAKLGDGNYVYILSAYSTRPYQVNGTKFTAHNYFAVSQVQQLAFGVIYGGKGMTVQQAYNIDKKMDDGLPLSGRVTTIASYATNLGDADGYDPAFYGREPAYITSGPSWFGAITPSATTCFDNNGVTATKLSDIVYSVTQNNGSGSNCFLSFEFAFQ